MAPSKKPPVSLLPPFGAPDYEGQVGRKKDAGTPPAPHYYETPVTSVPSRLAAPVATPLPPVPAPYAGLPEIGLPPIPGRVPVGLTPNYVIRDFIRLFDLSLSPSGRILGAMDPCCNDKEHPNVPAEVLYNREDNGFVQPWNKYILLNPPFGHRGDRSLSEWCAKADQVVRSGECPGVLLLCRVSTDTDYWQENLYPYPRVFLRRKYCQFKDYNNPPVGFGVGLFLLADTETLLRLTPRFFSLFAPYGTPMLPMDRVAVESQEVRRLVYRMSKRHMARPWFSPTKRAAAAPAPDQSSKPKSKKSKRRSEGSRRRRGTGR